MTQAPDGKTGFMRPLTSLLIVAIGGLAFVLALWLGAYGGDLAQGSNPGPHALSRSAIGYAGLVKLLKLEGGSVSMSRAAAPAKSSDLLIVTLSETPDAAALRRLVVGRRSLVILPKWSATPDPIHAGWIFRGEISPMTAGQAVKSLGIDNTLDYELHESFVTLFWRADMAQANSTTPDGLQTPNLNRYCTLRGKGLEPVLVDDNNKTVIARLSGTQTYILSEPDLLNNQGLATRKGAAIATDIVQHLSGGGPITFDLTQGGLSYQRNALKLLFQPPFGSASLCFLLLAILLAVQALVRFGPVARGERAFAFSKASLVDSAVSLLIAARREPKIAPRYLDVMVSRTAQSMGLPAALDGPQREAELDRLSRLRSITPLSQLTAEARTIKTRSALMTWADTVFRWSEEMTRGRR